MSNEEINRKIAEACGTLKWRQRIESRDGEVDYIFAHTRDDLIKKVEAHREGMGSWGINGEPESYNSINYCSDLNAMAEAEKTLTDPDFNAIQHRLNDYASNLVSISMEGRNHYSFMATARQRALAFLKTVAPKL